MSGLPPFLCMPVCVNVCICVYVNVCMCICMHMCVCECVCVRAHWCKYRYTHTALIRRSQRTHYLMNSMGSQRRHRHEEHPLNPWVLLTKATGGKEAVGRQSLVFHEKPEPSAVCWCLSIGFFVSSACREQTGKLPGLLPLLSQYFMKNNRLSIHTCAYALLALFLREL